MRILSAFLLIALLLPQNSNAVSSSFEFVHHISGNGVDRVLAVAIGADDSIYLAGITDSSDFEITIGSVRAAPVQSSPREPQLFLRRISSDGKRVLFSALLGPTMGNIALALDPQGNAYVAANFRNASWLPIVRALEPQGSVAILKVSAAGDALIYGATLLPEAFYAPPLALTVDAQGAAYVGTGTGKVVIRKLAASGQSFIYKYEFTCNNTYFSPVVNALAVGPDQSLYVAGRAACTGFPTTEQAWRKSTANPQNGEGYLIRLKPDGSGPIYSTLIGGESTDEVFSIAVDSSGRATVAGGTAINTGLPRMAAEPIGFSRIPENATQGFLAGFDAAGSTLEYAFLLPTRELTAVSLDQDSNPVIAGSTEWGALIAKIDPKTRTFRYAINAPASSARITSLATSKGKIVFGGFSSTIRFPDGNPNPPRNPVNGFAGKLAGEQPLTDLSLSVEAKSARPEIYGSTQSCVFRIRNSGPAKATDILLLAGGSSQNYRSWTADSSGFIVASFQTGFAGPAKALLPSLESGANAVIEFQGNTCSGILQSSTAETNLSNNVAAEEFQVIPTNRLALRAPFPGIRYQRDDWPILSVIDPAGIEVPVGGTVRIQIPSPQVYDPVGAIEFRSWSDNVTEATRIFRPTGSSDTIGINFNVLRTPFVDPVVGVTHGATSKSGPVAPGQIIALYGVNLGPATLIQAGLGADGRLVKELSGMQFSFDGVPAPFVYSSFRQASVIVPYSVAGKSSVKLQIRNSSGTSREIEANVTPTNPGLFTLDSTGAGQAIAVKENGTLSSKENPARRGEILVLYATGEGLTSPAQADGSVAVSPFAKPVESVSVTIGGQSAEVLYAGAAPGLTAGLMQVNVRVPVEVSAGNQVPVRLSVGQQSSPRGVNLAIR